MQLLLDHTDVDLTYEQCVGVTYEDVHDDAEAALATIIARYNEIARDCDAMVIVGTDYTDVAGPTEFDFNARIAANLGVPVALVVRGHDRTPDEVAQVVSLARAEIEADHANVVAVYANRCDPDQLEQILAVLPSDVATAALPESPVLMAPTVRQLTRALEGTLIAGEDSMLSREVGAIMVGAMNVEHLLERITEPHLSSLPATGPMPCSRR